MRPYLALTAHWITNEGGSLKLKASLIAFHYFPGLHTGEALAKLLLELLDRTKVTMKVHDLRGICCISALINVDQIGHLTMDNALNNIAAMHELAKLLEVCNIQFMKRPNSLKSWRCARARGDLHQRHSMAD